jgi:hypothetical protein
LLEKAGRKAPTKPTRIVDPPDGQVPYQPWARAKQQEIQANIDNPAAQRHIDPQARCLPNGPLRSPLWSNYEILQSPGNLVFSYETTHMYRIVPLDGRPHPSQNVKLWMGDSRGHWEGNTLVVDVRNNNSKARFARTAEFASENVKVQERYIFDNDRKHYNYVASFDDPTVFTRPFTTTIPARRYTVEDTPDDWHYQVALAHVAGKEKIPDHFERTCVENNGGFGRVALPSTTNSGTPTPAVAPAPAPSAAPAKR